MLRRKRLRRSLVVFLFDVDHVPIPSFAIGDAGRRVNIHVGNAEPFVDFGECSQVVIPLDETGVLGPCERPAELLSDTLEVLAPVRKDGELDVIGTVWHGAESEQVDVL